MANPSNAGPYEVGPNGTLSAGETRSIQLDEVNAGPGNKEAFLRKIYGERGGVDFMFIVNTSGELISVETKGGKTFIPPATSQNLNNGPYTSLRVTNEGANAVNTGSGDKVVIEVGNGDRSGQEPWTPSRAISDAIPGLRL